MKELHQPPDRGPEPINLDIAETDRYQTSFYRHARYYTVVAEQNYPIRLNWFVRQCCVEYGRGEPRRGLELGCGPALHAIDFAEEGVSMTALDISPEMLDIATEKAGARGTNVRLVHGNMIDYTVPEPVDFVMNLGLNSSHILTNEEMLTHLRAVSRSLAPGGLYFIELEFLNFGPRTVFRRFESPWIVYETSPAFYVSRGSSRGVRVTILWGGPIAYYDPIRQIFRSTNSIVVEEGERKEVIERPSLGKVYMPLEFAGLVALVRDLERVQWFSDYHLTAKFEGRPDADRYITVLRRKP